MKILKLLTFLLVLAVLQSCGNKPGKWANEAIPSNKRSTLHELNDELYKALQANNADKAEILISNDLMSSLGPKSRKLIELISLRTNTGKYKLFDEHYIAYDIKVPYRDSVMNHKLGYNSYKMNFAVPEQVKEIYVALMVPEGNEDKWMITCIWAKFNYGWKLAELDVNPYTINGKTAPEHYLQAKKEYERGYLIAALNTMDVAGSCFMPNMMWRYNIAEEMSRLSTQLTKEVYARYDFPLVFNEVPTKPQIFRVLNEKQNDKYYPAIWYQTHISLKDTAALHRENDQVKRVINQYFAGLCNDKKYVFYSVFSMPVKGKMMGVPAHFTDMH